MIPKTIYQTHYFDFDALPAQLRKSYDSWDRYNPSYVHRYFNDNAMHSYISSCGSEWDHVASLCRVPVMLADIWRYLIIYNEGGVYADLDAVCLEPVETWSPSNKQFVTAPESVTDICQWCFAAVPKHPLIKSVLDLILERFNHPLGPDYENPLFVLDLTGPQIWTDGIIKGLQCRGRPRLGEAQYYNNQPVARETGFHLHHNKIFSGIYVDHRFASTGSWVDFERGTWLEHQNTVYRKDRI